LISCYSALYVLFFIFPHRSFSNDSYLCGKKYSVSYVSIHMSLVVCPGSRRVEYLQITFCNIESSCLYVR
jgi:hypothetical protein